MLILSRKIGEEIVIGEAIRVEVLGVKQGQVRLGIKAPKQCRVLRAELLENGRDSRHDTDQSADDIAAANQ